MSSPQFARGSKLYLRALLVIGLLATGGAGGWALNDVSGHSTRALKVTVARGDQRPDRAASTAVSMPDLTGLDENGARQALAAVGAGPDRVQVTVVPAAGLPGIVVGQEPAAAQAVPTTGSLVLRIAQATTVPNLTGQSEEQARKALLSLGARVTRKEAYAPGASTGQVVGAEPAVGTTLPADVVLVVAQSPSSVFVDTLKAVSDACSTGASTISGNAYAQGLRCSPSNDPEVAEFTLAHLAGRFEATFGLDDRSSDQRPGRVRILVDGREVASVSAAFGQKVPVSADVRGGLRLRLEVSVLGTSTGCCSSPTVALADARLVGAPADIDALIAESGR